MAYKIVFKESAKQDLKSFDKSIVIQIIKKIDKLSLNPLCGEHLWNKMNMNLTWYYKLYAVDKKIRIIYSINNKEIIIEIIAIWKRDKGEVYKDLFKSIF